MRSRYNKVTRGWDEVVWTPPVKSKFPSVITDSHRPFKSLGDGEMYDSKSQYRKSLKQQGFVEVGNETNWASKPNKMPDVGESINRAMDELGYK